MGRARGHINIDLQDIKTDFPWFGFKDKICIWSLLISRFKFYRMYLYAMTLKFCVLAEINILRFYLF